MRKIALFVAVTLLAAAGPVAAQPAAPAQPPAPAAERKAPSGETRLNLKLDGPASLYVRETAAEPASGKALDNLPSLGGTAAPVERAPTVPAPERAKTPYPRDWQTEPR
jgi:hypothetical protein